jgi:hypothetical protein
MFIFDNFKLRKIPEIQGFYLDELFTAHMYTIDYDLTFIKSTQLKKGGGDNQNPLEAIFEKNHDDIDTLVSTNDQYKKKR